MTSPYETLGVPPTASPEDVRRAFRSKSRKAHPDSGGSKEELQKLSAAYHVLIDPARRKQFDETGSTQEYPSAFGLVAKMVIQCVTECLRVGQDPESVDILEQINARLSESIENLSTQQDQLKKLIAKFKKVTKRLTVKHGKENYLAEAMNAHVRLLESRVNAIPSERAKLEECLEFLKDYKYKPEAMKFVLASWGGTGYTIRDFQAGGTETDTT